MLLASSDRQKSKHTIYLIKTKYDSFFQSILINEDDGNLKCFIPQWSIDFILLRCTLSEKQSAI